MNNSFLGSQPRMVIWGTDVVVEDCREKFSRFLKTYTCSEFDSQGENRIHIRNDFTNISP